MAPNLNPLLGGGGRIRTYEGISQQIYSLPPLAAWVPLHKMSRVFCGSHPLLSMSNEHPGLCRLKLAIHSPASPPDPRLGLLPDIDIIVRYSQTILRQVLR